MAITFISLSSETTSPTLQCSTVLQGKIQLVKHEVECWEL